MKKYCLDASALFHIWEVYPPDVFPMLLDYLAPELNKQALLIDIIYDEVFVPERDWDNMTKSKQEEYPLQNWLKSKTNLIPINSSGIAKISDELQNKYKPRNKTKGVSSNDLRLIAYAKECQMIVVTVEKKQGQVPNQKANYRIPTVCDKENVKCLTLLEMLKKLKIRI